MRARQANTVLVGFLFALASCTARDGPEVNGTTRDAPESAVSRIRIVAANAGDLVEQLWEQAWKHPWNPPAVVEWLAPASEADCDSAPIFSLPPEWRFELYRSTPVEAGRLLHELMLDPMPVGAVHGKQEILSAWLTAKDIPNTFHLETGGHLTVPRQQIGRVSDLLGTEPSPDRLVDIFGLWFTHGDARIAPGSPMTFSGNRGPWVLRDVDTGKVVTSGTRASFSELTTVRPPPSGWATGHAYAINATGDPGHQSADFQVVERYPGRPVGRAGALIPFGRVGFHDGQFYHYDLACRPSKEAPATQRAVALAILAPGEKAPILEVRPGVHAIDPAQVILARWNAGDWRHVKLSKPRQNLVSGSKVLFQYLVILGHDNEALLSDVTVWPVEHAKGSQVDVPGLLTGTSLATDSDTRGWFAAVLETVPTAPR